MEVKSKNIDQQIQLAKKGNQSAYKCLLDTYWNQVYGFQLKRLKNEMDAEDITIETFAKAFDKIEQYDSKHAFSTWVITISKNLHIDKLRKNKINLAETSSEINTHINAILDDSPSPEDNLIIQQNLATLLRQVKQLKPHYQEVIQLRYFQEMSYKEIAEQCNEPINNIKVKLLRAKKLLAEIISSNT